MHKEPGTRRNPKIHEAKIHLGKVVGFGQRRGGHIVREARITEYDSAGRAVATHAAVAKKRRVAFEISRKELAQMQSTYRAFRKAGLPVPAFSKVFSRRGVGVQRPHYLTTFAEDLRARHGSLADVHEGGEPVFLRKLSVSKDARLIRELASDYAKICRLGYSTNFIDFWHFYKKPTGGYGRVIVDFDGFFRADPKSRYNADFWLMSGFHEFRDFMGKEEYALFSSEYMRLSGKQIPDLGPPRKNN